VIDYSWETRTTVRRLWGRDPNAGDKAIFLTAKANDQRYTQWLNSQREARDTSATPDPAVNNLQLGNTESREGSPNILTHVQNEQDFANIYYNALDIDSENSRR
jgi:hypothetical protein